LRIDWHIEGASRYHRDVQRGRGGRGGDGVETSRVVRVAIESGGERITGGVGLRDLAQQQLSRASKTVARGYAKGIGGIGDGSHSWRTKTSGVVPDVTRSVRVQTNHARRPPDGSVGAGRGDSEFVHGSDGPSGGDRVVASAVLRVGTHTSVEDNVGDARRRKDEVGI